MKIHICLSVILSHYSASFEAIKGSLAYRSAIVDHNILLAQKSGGKIMWTTPYASLANSTLDSLKQSVAYKGCRTTVRRHSV